MFFFDTYLGNIGVPLTLTPTIRSIPSSTSSTSSGSDGKAAGCSAEYDKLLARLREHVGHTPFPYSEIEDLKMN
jgi:hypothetical protein